MPRTRSQGIVIALLFGTLALIAYGSLYPFDLLSAAHRSFGQAILELSWARAGRSDRIVNILLYAPLGFCLLLLLEGRLRRSAAMALTITLSAVLSFSIEVTQVFIAQRVPSWWDVVFNTVGAIVGTTAGIAWRDLGNRMRTASGSGRADRGGMFVLLLFLAWRFAPYVPQLDIGKFKAAFAPLADPYFSATATVQYLLWWTLLAQIVFALVSSQRGIESLLVLIAVVLTSSLVIVGHGFVPSELLALMLLLPSLFLFQRLTPGPRRWLLLFAFGALMIYDSLAPFRQLHTAAGFDLWSFMTWIDAGFPVDWQWLARRACYFAALVWLLREAGVTPNTAMIFTPLFVLCLEVTQLWLLGRRATLTEPILALLVAWIMRALDASRTNHPRVRTH